MSHFIKSSVLVVSSFALVVAFQNCGQPGSVSAAPDLSKSQAPLVVDVVGEMQNQELPAKEDETKHNSRRRDDKEYDYELEEVLARYSCDEQASSTGSHSKKVMICHYPPGNAKARHEICISRSALDAHLNHGHGDESHQDHLGRCDKESED